MEEGVSFDELLAQQLEKPVFRRWWEDTIIQRAVSMELSLYRSRHGLSEAELALALGLPVERIRELEAMEAQPTNHDIVAICRALRREMLIRTTAEGTTAEFRPCPEQPAAAA
jgi:transcriptional regulator with XRE-family HTH domain